MGDFIKEESSVEEKNITCISKTHMITHITFKDIHNYHINYKKDKDNSNSRN